MLQTVQQDRALDRLEALLDEQAALRRVARLVASDPGPQEVFGCVCEAVGSVLRIQSTNLTRFEEDGTQTVLAAWSVEEAPVFPVRGGVPLDGDAAVPKVSRSGRPERVDDYGEVPGELAEMIRRAGIASAVAVPIKVAGRLWGAIVASGRRPHALPPDTEERIAAFAELAAGVIANADAREQLAASRTRLVEAADSERRRLERNLHDGAQQRLVALSLALAEVEATLGRDVDAARGVLRSAREELALAIDELRELARGIHPAVLGRRGLAPALRGLVARAPVRVEIDGLPEGRLPEQVEAAAYYLVTEALTNVSKHAPGATVTLRIVRLDDRVDVEVHDDGRGGADVKDGSGLRGLADRLDALGGRLEIASPEHEGTSLIGRIPLD
jgi:signal transduction histidine kinase